jgi:hypothetical protein
VGRRVAGDAGAAAADHADAAGRVVGVGRRRPTSVRVQAWVWQEFEPEQSALVQQAALAMQAPLQGLKPALQGVLQMPLVHSGVVFGGAGQSAAVQQNVGLGTQLALQTPLTQLAAEFGPAGQSASEQQFCAGMQTPLQSLKPVLQTKPQLPLLHVAVAPPGAGQTWPQLPQLFGSETVLQLGTSMMQAP